MKIPGYLKYFFIIILFAWISFFPSPIQDKYRLYAQIFFGIFLLILLLNKKYSKRLFSLQDWPLWLFLICMSGGVVNAVDKSIALKTYLYIAITFFLLFYIGKGIFHYGNDRKAVILTICICGCLVALIGLVELYFRKNIIYENFVANPYYERYIKYYPERYINYYPRPMSTQLNPAVLGSYLLGCLPFSFYFLKDKSLWRRWLGIVSLLLFIVVIMRTFSRGAFLAVVALASFYLWKNGKRKSLLLFLSFLLLFSFMCTYTKNINLNRFGFKRMIIGGYGSSISEYRLTRIKMATSMLKDYSIFGIGFNHFRIRFNEYYDKGYTPVKYEIKIPDNMYLTLLAETGIMGTLGFLVFIGLLLKKGLKRFKKLAGDNEKQMLLISLSALIGFLVNMAGYDLFYWNNPFMFFCLICGFIQGFV